MEGEKGEWGNVLIAWVERSVINGISAETDESCNFCLDRRSNFVCDCARWGVFRLDRFLSVPLFAPISFPKRCGRTHF